MLITVASFNVYAADLSNRFTRGQIERMVKECKLEYFMEHSKLNIETLVDKQFSHVELQAIFSQSKENFGRFLALNPGIGSAERAQRIFDKQESNINLFLKKMFNHN